MCVGKFFKYMQDWKSVHAKIAIYYTLAMVYCIPSVKSTIDEMST